MVVRYVWYVVWYHHTMYIGMRTTPNNFVCNHTIYDNNGVAHVLLYYGTGGTIPSHGNRHNVWYGMVWYGTIATHLT